MEAIIVKFSSKIQRCELSPMRKFAPYAVKAEQAGKKIYHLNIGQPDIETPPAYFEAVKEFSQKVLAYAPQSSILSPGREPWSINPKGDELEISALNRITSL